MDIRIKNRF